MKFGEDIRYKICPMCDRTWNEYIDHCTCGHVFPVSIDPIQDRCIKCSSDKVYKQVVKKYKVGNDLQVELKGWICKKCCPKDLWVWSDKILMDKYGV